MIENSIISEDESLKIDDIILMLEKKFNRINYDNAKKDVSTLTKINLDFWNEEYFSKLTRDLVEE